MRFAAPLILGVFLFTACAAGPGKVVILGPVPENREQVDAVAVTEVIDHERAAGEGAMPEWVARYVRAGIGGIESLPEYAGRYVFIGKQGGSNLTALQLWAEDFKADRDFPRLVTARILAQFTRLGEGNPGEVFGRYFDGVIQTAADTSFTGAVQGGSYWIKKPPPGDAETSPGGGLFEYYILIWIAREVLESQISLLLLTTQPELPQTREQAAAAARLRQSFYNGF
jgi:hypothetical protein